jgi:hypothetical protein
MALGQVRCESQRSEAPTGVGVPLLAGAIVALPARDESVL